MALRNFKVGLLATDTIADIKIGALNVTGGNYMTFEAPVGTDLQVTTGKTLYITRILYCPMAANGQLTIGYGDNGIPEQAGAPTNYVALSSAILGLVANTIYTIDCFFEIPADKYPCVKTLTAQASVNILGIEI